MVIECQKHSMGFCFHEIICTFLDGNKIQAENGIKMEREGEGALF